MTDKAEKRFQIPAPDDPRAANILYDFFYSLFAADPYKYLFEKDESDDDDSHIALFPYINRKLRESGRKEWPRDEAERLFNLADDDAYKKRKAKMRSRGGRKPTPQSRRVEQIRDALGCGKRWAYEIERDGAVNLADRVTLAAAFGHDPNWNRPVHWEPKRRRRRRGRPGAVDLTMRAFVLARADAFECEPPLDKLASLYSDGALPDDFPDLEAFLDVARDLGIDADPALATWESFKAWRGDVSARQFVQ